MLTSILGARLSWHFANGWVFDPAIVGPDIVPEHNKVEIEVRFRRTGIYQPKSDLAGRLKNSTRRIA